MVLGTTYIYVNDIEKSIDFYSKLQQGRVHVCQCTHAILVL